MKSTNLTTRKTDKTEARDDGIIRVREKLDFKEFQMKYQALRKKSGHFKNTVYYL